MQESEILESVAPGKDPLTAADVEEIVSAYEKLEKTKKNFILHLYSKL